MSSDSSSERSEKRAITDSKVDAYFPRPISSNDIPQLTSKGYKPITVEEEKKLLNQGIMTFYKGHLRSGCCEGCDDALRKSNRFARGRGELRPVMVQQHKYIDKRKIDCEKFNVESKVPLEFHTGLQMIKQENEKEITEENDQIIKDENDKYTIETLFSSIKPLEDINLTNDSISSILVLIDTFLGSDISDLFFNSSPNTEKGVNDLKIYISQVSEKIQVNLLNKPDLDMLDDSYSTFSAIVLTLIEECITRKEITHYAKEYLEGVITKMFSLTFKKMVMNLANLPVLKERKRMTSKVKFDHQDFDQSKTNEEFIGKRRRMDACPCCVKGKKINDII